MELIKAVRVRPNNAEIQERLGGVSDYKVELYKKNTKEYNIKWFQIGTSKGPVTDIEYKKSGFYKNFTDEELIIEGVKLLSTLNKRKYEIVQNPWNNVPPSDRLYGSDPYYLNNGSKVLIKWYKTNTNDFNNVEKWEPIFLKSFNNDESNVETSEFEIFFKTVTIYAPDSYTGSDKIILIDKLNQFSDIIPNIDQKIFYMKDMDILNYLVELWRKSSLNTETLLYLDICDKNYEPCLLIPYVSPISKTTNIEDIKLLEEDNINSNVKKVLRVVLPNSIKSKEDVDIIIYIEPDQFQFT